jgi:c-di-GMP-binding flagellar brake protein YcgR
MLASSVTFWRWLTGQPVALAAVSESDEAGAERRVWLRYVANLSIRCEQVNGEADAGVLASVCDLSRGGMQMIAPRRFEPGSMISVELPAAREDRSLAVLACVIRTQPHGESDWLMGCRFASELNEQQLQAFGAARARPKEPDARGWARFPCEAKAFFQRVTSPDQAHLAARLLNISVGGMAILTQEEVVLGELLNTELHDPNDQLLVTILACVVHSQKIADGHLLGCNFIRELTDEDIRALL